MITYIVQTKPDIKISNIKLELARNLASFMIPEFFVKMFQIPLNTNGKFNVTKLPILMRKENFFEEMVTKKSRIE